MPGPLSASRLANVAASAIGHAFFGYVDDFRVLTRRAGSRFEGRDWSGAIADAADRLDLYARALSGAEKRVRATLGPRLGDRLVWTGMKAVYSGLIAGREDWELAETFFNSVTRRAFATVGVDRDIEFVDSDFEAPAADTAPLVRRVHPPAAGGGGLVAAILAGSGFQGRFEDLRRDAMLAGRRLDRQLRRLGGSGRVEGAEILSAPCYRRKGAYLVGRVFSAGRAVPLALALLQGERGLVLDAVLSDEDDLSILFSFTRSHFHVDLWPPHALVGFLKELMPRKPIAEIYIALGHHKHGKTELYRDLLRHLRDSDERFGLAPGTPGLVMVVFAMPGYEVVFKVIRDRFPAVKPGTPQGVIANYRLVFRHDRAGRLVEAQEFEHLRFDRSRFDPELLAEFRRDADRTVEIDSREVVIHHAYLERRVRPLDLHLRETVDPGARRAAVLDFGQAVKDLAASNIFPGELLAKNFGLTRHGRVVCYDYDELALLTDFCFRELPAAAAEEDELADETWFGVGPRDIFPEEFARFVALPADLRRVLWTAHGELAEPDFWRGMQARVGGGEIVDIFPYHRSRRLREG